jgi:DUF4097 and DUF4098 domain-containing protein YvlB
MKPSLQSLALLAVTALGAGCVVKVGPGGISWDGDSITLDHTVQREETYPLSLAPGDMLDLDTGYGSVDVTATTDGRSELRAIVHATGRTDEEARAVLARYEVVIERGSKGPRVRLEGEPLTLDEGNVHMQIPANVSYLATVPAGTPLIARTSSGDIQVRGAVGSSRLETTYGAVNLDEVRGNITAKSSSGDVNAGRVEGEQVELTSSYGAVRLNGAKARSVSCSSGSGNIEVGPTQADELDLVTSYGHVIAHDCSGKLRARTGSGDVRLRGVRGAIDAESSYGSVDIEGELSELRARSGSGPVTARAAETSRVESSWSLSSSYGSVALSVPEGFDCELDAKTGWGEVECDFPITVGPGKKQGETHLRGTVGDGGGEVQLSSGSGDVALKRLKTQS